MKISRIWVAILVGFLVFYPGFSYAAEVDGSSRQFFVNTGYDGQGRSRISVTLKRTSDYALWYVDDAAYGALSPEQRSAYDTNLSALIKEFDLTIWPRSVSLWGGLVGSSVDTTGKVSIVLQDLNESSGGYFETVHNYSTRLAPTSNERRMVFLNSDGVLTGQAKMFLAHEFQHLLSFEQKERAQQTEEDIWLNEVRSEYNITALGYSEPFVGSSLQRRMRSFVRAPSDSLTVWPNTATDYAIAAMFGHYVADRFGAFVLADALKAPVAGANSLDVILRRQGTSFAEVFIDWMVASYLNDASVGQAYQYTRPELRETVVTPRVLEPSQNGSLYRLDAMLSEWQPLWVQARVARSSSPAQYVSVGIINAPAGVAGKVIARYQNGSTTVTGFAGVGTTKIPVLLSGAGLDSVTMAVAHGSLESVDARVIVPQSVRIVVALGDIPAEALTTPLATQPTQTPSLVAWQDGDLVWVEGETYQVFGAYRRLIVPAVRASAYNGRNPVSLLPSDAARYRISNYVRAIGDTKVYAVWPDGTKHWMDITAKQWEDSGRDWKAIFNISPQEVAQYPTGPSITR
jgi:hypothetical protein